MKCEMKMKGKWGLNRGWGKVGRHGQLMSLVTINWMVQKIIEIHCRSVERRVEGKRRVSGKRGDDEQCLQAVNFRTAKFRRLRKFAT